MVNTHPNEDVIPVKLVNGKAFVGAVEDGAEDQLPVTRPLRGIPRQQRPGLRARPDKLHGCDGQQRVLLPAHGHIGRFLPPHHWVSTRLAATTVTFSRMVLPSSPVSSMPAQRQPVYTVRLLGLTITREKSVRS